MTKRWDLHKQLEEIQEERKSLRNQREWNLPHVQVGVIFFLSFILYIFILIF